MNKQDQTNVNPKIRPGTAAKKAAKAAYSALAERKHALHKTMLAAIILVTAAVLWPGGNIVWDRVSLGGKTISGTLSDSSLEKLVQTNASNYHVQLKYPSGEVKSYSLSDMGVSVDAHASVDALRRAQISRWHWIVWWQPIQVQLVTRVDNTAFSNFIAQNARIEYKPARNASMTLNDGAVTISPGENGLQYSFPNASRTLLNAAKTLQTKPLLLTSVTKEPSISAQNLETVKTQIDKILNQQIKITMGSETATPSSQNIASWLTLTPGDRTYTVGLNHDELRGYLQNIADEHSRDARSQVISSASGAVLVSGANGTQVSNNISVDDDLANKILAGDGATLSMPVKTVAYRTVHAPSAGKWIEIDTTTKRMFAYDNDEVVRSFLISAGAAGTPTVTGQFAIYSKVLSQDMSGSNLDGSRYIQPDVPYVNYFYRDYAIHGNYWRPASYFGFINSSHGCVGVSVSEGAWIYSWAPVGTPVIIHT